MVAHGWSAHGETHSETTISRTSRYHLTFTFPVTGVVGRLSRPLSPTRTPQCFISGCSPYRGGCQQQQHDHLRRKPGVHHTTDVNHHVIPRHTKASSPTLEAKAGSPHPPSPPYQPTYVSDMAVTPVPPCFGAPATGGRLPVLVAFPPRRVDNRRDNNK